VGHPAAYDSWAAGWRLRLEEEPVSGVARAAAMRMASPAFIPRNHIVEAALDAAVERRDFQPFEELLDVVSRPYEDRPDRERYSTPAPSGGVRHSDFLRDVSVGTDKPEESKLELSLEPVICAAD
jgi:uncharacterized protein YdiU (UPF0061 family)